MKFIGIVAEYNPFHNGHAYQIKKSKESLEADGVVAIMSGNFVQRGMPAFMDKWTRTEMALRSGVNLVLELPTYYATSSAELFAKGAVSLLTHTGITTHLSFGSEMDSMDLLNDMATILTRESEAYKRALKEQLDQGLSFPKARSNVLEDLLDIDISLNQSNMILALEYLKALKSSGSTIEPYLVKRVGSNYHDESLSHNLSSATAIRKGYFNNPNEFDFSPYMPREAYQVLRKTKYTPLDIKSFEKELLILIRRSTPEELNRYREVNEGLNYKLKSLSNQVSTYEELVTGLKSKRYTQTKINRLLINILLGIEKEDHTIDEVGYLRILGFDETGRNMAHLMKKNASLPVITNINKVEPSLKKNPLLQLDIRASDIYAAGQNNPKHRTGGRDHTQKIIIL